MGREIPNAVRNRNFYTLNNTYVSSKAKKAPPIENRYRFFGFFYCVHRFIFAVTAENRRHLPWTQRRWHAVYITVLFITRPMDSRCIRALEKLFGIPPINRIKEENGTMVLKKNSDVSCCWGRHRFYATPLRFLLAGIFFFAGSQLALATEENKGLHKLDDVVVSATKMETELKDISTICLSG
jgi:hypothetical protein